MQEIMMTNNDGRHGIISCLYDMIDVKRGWGKREKERGRGVLVRE